eukprot:CAMPEP_0175040984 /NCGR_PEP_ID=MMETSP0052_2-20121109/1629_1 /TAXON_ID=51329 ORGANISM="Polytomella parva, Strain SAG 63-3" /NCGR_SAMPLE_ID=MMETSP0052_2 /ASSEMBLY_ACC=CAM_ASM_000194 /LENGTH=59 /DNA_ID=CAMNT_0016303381 /DNA_START=86 /DNA_END=261 /DNA_ORIENTATION=-
MSSSTMPSSTAASVASASSTTLSPFSPPSFGVSSTVAALLSPVFSASIPEPSSPSSPSS